MLEVMRDILQSRYLRSNVAHKQLARTSLRALDTLLPPFLFSLTFRPTWLVWQDKTSPKYPPEREGEERERIPMSHHSF